MMAVKKCGANMIAEKGKSVHLSWCVCVCKRDREGGNSLDPGKFLTEWHNFTQGHGHFITTVIPSQPADRDAHSRMNNLHYSEHNSCMHLSHIIPSVSIKGGG